MEDGPKTNKKRRLRRKKKSTKGVEKQAALQYQLVLEQQKNESLEKLRDQNTKADGLTTELTKLLNEFKVDLQQETQSFDGFLWKLMPGLDTGQAEWDCAPFLRTLTALYNGMTRSLDLLLVMSGMRDSLVDGNLPESIG